MSTASATLTVQSVRYPTASSVQLTFAAPAEPLRYRAGQYLTFRVLVDGRPYFRAYSLVGSPFCSDPLSILAKRVEGGVVSTYLQKHAKAGLSLSVSVPQGRFFVEPGAQKRRVVLVGGGSGITPLYAIARELLHGEAETTVSLLYCNVSPEEIILYEEINTLAAEYPGRFRVVHVVERNATRVGALALRLDVQTAAELLRDIDLERDASYYLCGPSGLMDVVREACRVLHVSPMRVFEEKFEVTQDHGASGEIHSVRLLLGGREYQLNVPSCTSLLDAALESGVPVDSSCRVGDCGTCKLLLMSGSVEQSKVEGLSPEEETAGYVLSCVSRPRSAALLVGP